MREGWERDAACRSAGHGPFFADDPAEAKRICAACPVARDCREYADRGRIEDGVYGGETADERRSRWRREARRRLAEKRQRNARVEAIETVVVPYVLGTPGDHTPSAVAGLFGYDEFDVHEILHRLSSSGLLERLPDGAWRSV